MVAGAAITIVGRIIAAIRGGSYEDERTKLSVPNSPAAFSSP